MDIQPAPPRYVLQEFGGPLSIQEFRASFHTGDTFVLTEFPLIHVLQQVRHERTDRDAVKNASAGTPTETTTTTTTTKKNGNSGNNGGGGKGKSSSSSSAGGMGKQQQHHQRRPVFPSPAPPPPPTFNPSRVEQAEKRLRLHRSTKPGTGNGLALDRLMVKK